MKKITCILFIFIVLYSFSFVQSQTITWEDVTANQTLPEGVKLLKGTRSTPKLQAWILDVDLNNTNLAVRPYIGASAIVPTHTANNEAFAAINAGFFGGSTSYSAVVYPGELKAKNVGALTRNSLSYPVMRSMFSVNTKFQCSVDWIYHYGDKPENIYTFDAPMSYAANDPTPQSAPNQSNGGKMTDILVGIGGAPVLIKDGEKRITYNEEIMWGSGVGLDNRDPRTAVGYTADNHVIMFVADGRQASTVSEGVSLSELADILLSFNCVEAMNLDGGGSSGMAVGNKFVSSPSEQRAVPSILAITTRDKVKMAGVPDFEQIIDTESANAEKIGSGWFETANSGFYGNSKSLLAPKGNGVNYYKFNITPPADMYSEVYGWWVSATNRAQNTPYIVKFKNGADTVYVNQTQNGSSWVRIGKYVFKGDGSDWVAISDEATLGSYVVADAIRVISFGEKEQVNTNLNNLNTSNLYDIKAFPNPAAGQTTISFHLTKQSFVQLTIYNSNGQVVSTLVSEDLPNGTHNYVFDGGQRGSGLYIYTLMIEGKQFAGKIIVE